MRPLPPLVPRRPLLTVLAAITVAALGAGGCQHGELEAVPAPAPGTFHVTGPDTYGDDAVLDRLWQECAGGAELACDDLYWSSPVGSRYERMSIER